MKPAVITPYYKEDLPTLRRCHLSVVDQGVPCRHFFVADGFPSQTVQQWDCEHITLSREHHDYGNTPRGIGALSAIGQGYGPVFFLDADNWYSSEHVERAIDLKRRSPDIDVVASLRTVVLPCGTIVDPDEEDVKRLHIDTSCYAFFESSFFILPLWCTMTKPLSVIGDRVIFAAIRQHQLNLVWSEARTLFYSSHYAHHYVRAGLAPPSDSYVLDMKRLENFSPDQLWSWSRMRMNINRV